MEAELILTKDHGIAHITLNRPQQHNAFDDHFIIQLSNLLLTLQSDPQTKVVLIKASGKNFSAGADLNWMKRMKNFSHAENGRDAEQLMQLLNILANFSKPTIALAKGQTLGGGVGLLACCDMVIATKTARFCFSEVKLGLIPALISPYIVAAMGLRATTYYFLTAKGFDADQAKQMGLVQELCEEPLLDKQGLALANSLLENGPEALYATKQLLHRFKNFDQSLLQETAELIANIRVSPEAQEGLGAFLEKRKPNWIIDNDPVK